MASIAFFFLCSSRLLINDHVQPLRGFWQAYGFFFLKSPMQRTTHYICCRVLWVLFRRRMSNLNGSQLDANFWLGKNFQKRINLKQNWMTQSSNHRDIQSKRSAVMFIHKPTDEFGNIFCADIQETSSGIKCQAKGKTDLHDIPLIT